MSVDVAVLGAGPAGLAAALVAARRGFSVTVLERSDTVGGMAGSYEVGGQRVDHGSHRLHPSIDPAILAELRAMLGDDLQVRQRHGRINLEGRWLAFPLRTGDMLRRLPPRFALGAARDAVTGPLRSSADSDEASFSDVVRARLGPTVARQFYEPYAEKLWGLPPTRLSGELARRRVSASSPLDIARRLVRARRPEGRTFLYPRGGFGQISEALADAAASAGADIRLASSVEQLDVSDGRLVVHTADGAAVECAHVWSSLPVALLPRLVGPPAPAEVVHGAASLRHRGLLLVHLVVPRPQYTPFDAHYFPAVDNPVARLSEPKNYRDSADDPARLTVLCAEVPCWEGDERWTASDAELGAEVADALRRTGLPSPDHTDVVVRRLPRVYPVMEPDTAGLLARTEQWVTSLPGVATFGRQGLFVPDNTHHVLTMGWALGRSLSDAGRLDRTRWDAERAAFRSHVVED